jgi:hypothetical protein
MQGDTMGQISANALNLVTVLHAESQACRFCGKERHPFSEAQILRKISVKYYRCGDCGGVQTQDAHWLEEAYESPITSLDVGLINRCIWSASIVETFMRISGNVGPHLDWAGGYGILTRILRDRGIDSHHYDPFTPNLFAPETADPESREWGITSMFEVWEHLQDPVKELRHIADQSTSILFSTELLPEPAPQPGDWWYYALETGQHISFYTEASLRGVAKQLDMELATDGKSLHILYRRERLPFRAKMFLQKAARAAPVLAPLLRRLQKGKSLTNADCDQRRRELRASSAAVSET